MKRFSVLYLLQERHQHIGCATNEEARSILQNLSMDKGRRPVGIYDAKTELFEWESTRQREYDEADISKQGRLGNQIITIAQALRRRDASWHKPTEFQKPSFFA